MFADSFVWCNSSQSSTVGSPPDGAITPRLQFACGIGRSLQQPPVRTLIAIACVLPLLNGCVLFPDDVRPRADLRTEVADKFVQRGMPQNRNGVLQGSIDVTMPTRTGGELALGTFANMDLRDNVGRAWYADGHAGRFSDIEFTATYAQSAGPVDLNAGIHNYNVPFGAGFPNGPRSSTSEIFVHASSEVLGARPEVQLRYDVDQADGFYGRIGVNEEFPITDTLKLRSSVFVGYSTRPESFWNYGIRESGFSDLLGSVTLLWTYDAHTTLGINGNVATILDGGLQDWFDQIGIPTTNTWVGLFAQWTY